MYVYMYIYCNMYILFPSVKLLLYCATLETLNNNTLHFSAYHLSRNDGYTINKYSLIQFAVITRL